MNFKGIILAVVSFLLVAVSCSVDNDTIMNDMDKEMSAAGNQEAYLAFNLNGMTTKSDTQNPETEEAAITSCSVIIAKADNSICAAMDEVEVVGNALQTKLLVKAAKNMKVVIIVNSTQKFANYTSLNQVYETVQNKTDLDSFVKMGETTLGNLNAYASTTEAIANPNTVNVKLIQLSARIELGTITLTSFSNGVSAKYVTLQKMELINANNSCLTNTTKNFNKNFTTKEYAINSTVHAAGETFGFAKTPVLYSFPNVGQSGDNQLKVRLTFDVEGSTVEKEYTINKGLVESGYLYRLNVKVKIEGQNVDIEVQGTIENWTYNSLNLGDINAA